MINLFRKRWRFETAGTSGNAILFGVNIFDYQWNRTGEQVTVLDPKYNQVQTADVCETVIKGKNHRFAVCELHMDYYAFYLLKHSSPRM